MLELDKRLVLLHVCYTISDLFDLSCMLMYVDISHHFKFASIMVIMVFTETLPK